jgi:hypothetical protein
MGFDFNSTLTGEAIFRSMMKLALEKDAQSYMARGRTFSGLGIEALNQEWTETNREWLSALVAMREAQAAMRKHPGEAEENLHDLVIARGRRLSRRQADLRAEYHLRGIDPPFDGAWFRSLQAEMRADWEQDPAACDETIDEMLREFADGEA